MAILGLTSTETYSSERFKNVRRSVFYFYPNGAAPLTGLLSLMDEEDTDDPEFSHWEKRLSTQRTETASHGSSEGPFTNTSGVVMSDPFTWTADTSYRVHLDDAEIVRVQNVVLIRADDSSGDSKDLLGQVTAINSSASPEYITVRAINTVSGIINGATNENVDKQVWVVGNAAPQGVIDLAGQVYNSPVEFQNYTQIFRTPFSIAGTALKTSLKYDETGPYRDKAKEHSVMHMIELEKSFLFGRRHKYVPSGSVDPTTGTGLPIYHTGGILWFLEQWEAANSTYRGGTGAPAVTSDTDDDKRIINNNSGLLNEKSYDGFLERVFRVTNNTANEKLVLCGSGFLNVINQLYKSKSVLNADLPMTDTYGMNVVSHLTPFGKVFYKTHPLFSQNPVWRFNALIVDVKNLKYRYMQGRDTELLKNREPNDADYRKDEWFTECGLELRFPESFMLLKNVQDYEP